ncbi:hypothetical protein ACFQPG_11805 [Sphingomonas sp. GCM10030256]|uniref:hypothetical protein n=1 Tax=Sphingomonas sp. GCM10030256 TaxID=3273427 RepID=UPI003620935D
MRTHVKDFIDIGDFTSLDRLITTLTAIRDSLPADAEPELKMRGDDVFGRRFSISYLRALTAEELAQDARYAQPRDREIERLSEELKGVDFTRRRKAA